MPAVRLTQLPKHNPVIDGPYYSVLIGEWVAATAFGASWFAKGAEIKYLFFGHDEPGTVT